MSTITQPSRTISKPRRLPADLLVRNMWGGNVDRGHSAVAVALFAWLATKAVAKHGLSGGEDAAGVQPS